MQRNAMRAWDEELDFRALVERRPGDRGRLDAMRSRRCSTSNDALQHVDVLFERLAALADPRGRRPFMSETAVHVA